MLFNLFTQLLKMFTCKNECFAHARYVPRVSFVHVFYSMQAHTLKSEG